MLDQTVNLSLYCCDYCKTRIPSTSRKTCIICKKEICQYCRIRLIRSKRKFPDSGYFSVQIPVGYICLKCSNKKLGTREER